MPSTFNDIAQTVANAASFDDFARGLLAILGDVSHFDTVFVTRVDADLKNCEIAYARNTQVPRMRVVEGSVVPWSDSTCQSALAEGIRFVQKADEHWDHLQVVHDLNICTYAVEPIQDAGGRLLGTLCAVSARRLPIDEGTQDVMRTVSRLLAERMDAGGDKTLTPGQREALGRLRRQITRRVDADPGPVDALTRLPSRAGLVAELDRLLAVAAREDRRALVTFVDLVGFEVIDEANGHPAADGFLYAVAERLRAALRDGEFLARLGDREFAVAVLSRAVAARADEVEAEAAERGERLRAATVGLYTVDWGPLDYQGAAVGTVPSRPGDDAVALLRRAGEAMTAARPVEPPNLNAPENPLPSRGRASSYGWYD